MQSGIAEAFGFLLKSLATLYIGALIVRFILQFVRANFTNPAAQFLLRLTHPVIRPVRRVIPPVGTVDLAMLVVIVALYGLTVFLLGLLKGGVLDPLLLLRITLGGLLHLTLNIYLGAIFIMVIFSWISPGGYHPVAGLVDDLTYPVLRPFRQLLPTAGGIDFSPMLTIIILFFVKKLLDGFGLHSLWVHGL